MSLLEAIVLGAVQGLTEFMPVSSDGHLALVPRLLQWGQPPLTFVVAVHWGTLAAVLIGFRKDIVPLLRGLACGPVWLLSRLGAARPLSDERRAEASLTWLLGCATVPAALVGLGADRFVERSASSLGFVGVCLIANALILVLSDALAPRGEGRCEVSWGRGMVIGMLQVLALLPGVSRSGTTIGTGLVLGVDRDQAVRFSFLLSIPAILGAGLLEGAKALEANLSAAEWGAYLVGAAVAGAAGWVAIRAVFHAVRRGRFAWFGVYCGLVGLGVLAASVAGQAPV
jgi:undecaprenyl-diphosphatase